MPPVVAGTIPRQVVMPTPSVVDPTMQAAVAGNVPAPVSSFDTVNNAANAEFNRLAADDTISDFERGGRQLGQRALRGASALGEVTTEAGNLISDALTGLDNIGTTVGNFFRSPADKNAYLTKEEGRSFFTGGSKEQKATRARVAASKISPNDSAKVVDKLAADGKAAAEKELSKLYPEASKEQLSIMLDEMGTNNLNLGINPTVSQPRF